MFYGFFFRSKLYMNIIKILTLSSASLSGWPAICTRFSVITNAGVVSTIVVVFCGTAVAADAICGGGAVIAAGDVANIGDVPVIPIESPIGDDKGLDVSVRLRSFPLPNGPIGRTRYCLTPITCKKKKKMFLYPNYIVTMFIV